MKFRTKSHHETPVTPKLPRDQSQYVSPFFIHPRKSSTQPTSSNHEVVSLLEELKQHILLLEDGLMVTMPSEQQATFLDKRNLFMPRVLQNDEHVHQKEPHTESTPVPQDKMPQTESTPEVHVSSSQPTPYDPSTSDKGKLQQLK